MLEHPNVESWMIATYGFILFMDIAFFYAGWNLILELVTREAKRQGLKIDILFRRDVAWLLFLGLLANIIGEKRLVKIGFYYFYWKYRIKRLFSHHKN
jgi:hypothetical protein